MGGLDTARHSRQMFNPRHEGTLFDAGHPANGVFFHADPQSRFQDRASIVSEKFT